MPRLPTPIATRMPGRISGPAIAVKTLAEDGFNIERPRRWITLREMKHLRQAWKHGGNDTRDPALLEANPLRVARFTF